MNSDLDSINIHLKIYGYPASHGRAASAIYSLLRARTADAGNHHELNPWNIHVDILQVVRPSTANLNCVSHKSEPLPSSRDRSSRSTFEITCCRCFYAIKTA